MSSFQPMGKTITFTAATVAPTPVQAVSNNSGAAITYLVCNTGSVWAFMSAESVTGNATANSVIPTSTSQYSIAVAPGSTQTFTLPKDAFFSGITASGSDVIYVTPGYGE